MTRGTSAYVLQRLVLITFTAVVISSVVFIGQHVLLPGDAFVSEKLRDPALMRERLHHYNLDLPLQQQYFLWVTGSVCLRAVMIAFFRLAPSKLTPRRSAP